MNNKFIVLFLLVFIVLFSCGPSIQLNHSKAVLDFDSIDSIFIIRRPDINNEIGYKVNILTKYQRKVMVRVWNRSEHVGTCTFEPDYDMTVYLTNKKTRTFSINASYIKEGNGECYDMGDVEFIENLFFM